MNHKYISLLILILFAVSGCEKDDICDENTDTTPRLVITFYDFNNPAIEKQVSNLQVFGAGIDDPIANFNAVSEIALPLQTTGDSTSYVFTLDSGDTSAENTDNLQINYTRTETYVSRACGFKTTFTLDPATPFILQDEPVMTDQWIKNITVAQPSIINEDETHINIYF